MEKTLLMVYPNCSTQSVHSLLTMEQVARLIREDDSLKRETESYRRLMAGGIPSKQLKALKTERFPMLMPAATFDMERKMDCLKEYTCFCQCDIDHVKPEQMEEMRRRLRELPFVVMFYTSMSGTGLHVYFRYLIPNEGFSPEVYEQAFRQGNELIAEALAADYDGAVEKPNHGSCICHDADVWYNPGAELLRVDMSVKVAKRAKKEHIANAVAVTEDQWGQEWTAERVMEHAQRCVDRSTTGVFAPGNRHNYLVRLALTLSDFGMRMEHAQELMEAAYAADYGEESISAIVASCYRKAQHLFGMRALPRSERKAEKGAKMEDVKMWQAGQYLQKQDLRFDIITHKTLYKGRELTERDICSMLLECCKETRSNISMQTFRAALQSNCVPEFNPLTDYLDKAVSEAEAADAPKMRSGSGDDGDDDVDGCMCAAEEGSVIERVAGMVHVAPAPVTSDEKKLINMKELLAVWVLCFKKWFVSMVASWMFPSVVNHQMLVLIGPQGIFKSTWLDALIPPELVNYRCRQSGMNFSDKDEMLRCTEFALINYDEFDCLRGAGLDNLKSLITTPDVNVRAPYGSVKERRVRIASYCASGNKHEFLTDQTGNRRFLPFYVEHIDSPFENPIPYSALYAEAVRLIREGYEYWFSLDDINRIAEHVEQFHDRLPEEELVDIYFDVPGPMNEELRPVKFLTASEISAKMSLYGNLKKPVQLRVLSQILDRKGFQKVRQGHKGTRGYLVVELETSEVNSGRIVSTGVCNSPF